MGARGNGERHEQGGGGVGAALIALCVSIKGFIQFVASFGRCTGDEGGVENLPQAFPPRYLPTASSQRNAKKRGGGSGGVLL